MNGILAQKTYYVMIIDHTTTKTNPLEKKIAEGYVKLYPIQINNSSHESELVNNNMKHLPSRYIDFLHIWFYPVFMINKTEHEVHSYTAGKGGIYF